MFHLVLQCVGRCRLTAGSLARQPKIITQTMEEIKIAASQMCRCSDSRFQQCMAIPCLVSDCWNNDQDIDPCSFATALSASHTISVAADPQCALLIVTPLPAADPQCTVMICMVI